MSGFAGIGVYVLIVVGSFVAPCLAEVESLLLDGQSRPKERESVM